VENFHCSAHQQPSSFQLLFARSVRLDSTAVAAIIVQVRMFARSVRLHLIAFAAIIVTVRMWQANQHHGLDDR